jgi:hypothetical protein
MARMSWKVAFEITVILVAIVSVSGWLQKTDTEAQGSSSHYPEPRFPSSTRLPVFMDDLMPYARKLVRNAAAFAGFGLGVAKTDEPAASPMIVFSTGVSPIIWQAIRRAELELHRTPVPIWDYELVGVSQRDAEALKKFNDAYTSEKGFMEVSRWFQSWPNPKVPRDWLKATRPDLYTQLYPPEQVLPEYLESAKEKLTTDSVGKALQDFLPRHPEVNPGVFWGSGDWIALRRALGPFGYQSTYFTGLAPRPDQVQRALGPFGRQSTPYPFKPAWLGPALFSDLWIVMSEVSSYPADVWELSEEKTIEPIANVDRVRVTDPEGTDLSFEIPEDLAQRWAKGIYERGHIMLFPNMASGRFARSIMKYPALENEWIPREPLALANGVVGGTAGPKGFFPRIEIHFKDGYVSDVVGGGTYGELLRTFLKYPNINSAKYPYQDRPGYFYLYEIALGTNPKWLRDPDLMMVGDLSTERMRSGVLHFGLGLGLEQDDPSAAGKSPTWQAFTAQYNLPADHGFHVHNYFATYRVHLRKSDKWVTLIEGGRMASLDDPEVRTLASRYGDPAKILAEDWVPEVPGINAPGKYEDYARNPWNYAKTVINRVIAGTYEHYYPPIKLEK